MLIFTIHFSWLGQEVLHVASLTAVQLAFFFFFFFVFFCRQISAMLFGAQGSPSPGGLFYKFCESPLPTCTFSFIIVVIIIYLFVLDACLYNDVAIVTKTHPCDIMRFSKMLKMKIFSRMF